MKLLLTGLLGLSCLTAPAATLIIPSQQNTGHSNNRQIILAPLSGPRFFGNILTHSGPFPITAAQGTNGVWVEAGPWRITVDGLPGFLDITVPLTNGTVNASDCAPPGAPGNTNQSFATLLVGVGTNVTLYGSSANTNVLTLQATVDTHNAIEVEALGSQRPAFWVDPLGNLAAPTASFAGGAITLDADGGAHFAGGALTLDVDAGAHFAGGTFIDGLGALTVGDSIQCPQLNVGGEPPGGSLAPAIAGGLVIGGAGWNVYMYTNGIKSDHGYLSSDGSAGMTASQTFKDGSGVTKTMTIKNGLIVQIQ